MPTPVAMSWSGGKDCALALYRMLQDPDYQVVSLLTTVSAEFGRISHHGVRIALLEQQAASIGIPLRKVALPATDAGPCTMEQYDEVMAATMSQYRNEGVHTFAFGDILLEDIRAYRENRLARMGMRGIFPIWGLDTITVFETFLQLGFKACVACVDGERLGAHFAGRMLDATFGDDLPEGIDLCGERGEYHSFVFDGPVFRLPIAIETGQRVEREGRHHIDLLPAESSTAGHEAATETFPPVGRVPSSNTISPTSSV